VNDGTPAPSGPPARTGTAPGRRLLWFAAACVVVAAVIYALALGFDGPRGVDRDLRYPQIVADWRVRDDASDRFAEVVATAFAVWGVAIAVVAFAVGRLRRTALVGAALGLGALATLVASEVLGRLDPLGGEVLRYRIDADGMRYVATGGFPSGHSAFAMALAVATVLALPPRLRPAGLVLAPLPVSAVCVGMMALGWHYPSDILGGVLLSAAAGAAVAASSAWPRERAVTTRPSMVGSAVAGALALCAAAGAWGLARLPDESAMAFMEAHPRFVGFGVLTAIVVTGCLAVLSGLVGSRNATEEVIRDPRSLTPGESMQ